MGDLRAEWTRLWSLRSPWACLAGAAVAFLLCTAALANDAVRAVELGEMPAGTMTSPVDVLGPATQMAIGLVVAFSILPLTGEYANGSIRTAMLGQPQRWRLLAAKTAVVAVPAAVVLTLVTLGRSAAAGAVLGATWIEQGTRASRVG